jgi:hypothetical protein
MKHELVQLTGKIDRAWIDDESAAPYSDNGRPGIETRFVIGLCCSSTSTACPTKAVCGLWIYDPYLNLAQRRTLAIDQVSGTTESLLAIDEAPNFLENQVRFLVAGCAQPHRTSAARR